MARMARAMSAASFGSQRTPQPVSRTIGAMPGRPLATTGVPAPIASNSFVGGLSRGVRVGAWAGTVGRAAPPGRLAAGFGPVAPEGRGGAALEQDEADARERAPADLAHALRRA